MTDAKICPMHNTTCIREKCAWWMMNNKCCSILDIAANLDSMAVDIDVALRDIAVSLRHTAGRKEYDD